MGESKRTQQNMRGPERVIDFSDFLVGFSRLSMNGLPCEFFYSMPDLFGNLVANKRQLVVKLNYS